MRANAFGCTTENVISLMSAPNVISLMSTPHGGVSRRCRGGAPWRLIRDAAVAFGSEYGRLLVPSVFHGGSHYYDEDPLRV